MLLDPPVDNFKSLDLIWPEVGDSGASWTAISRLLSIRTTIRHHDVWRARKPCRMIRVEDSGAL